MTRRGRTPRGWRAGRRTKPIQIDLPPLLFEAVTAELTKATVADAGKIQAEKSIETRRGMGAMVRRLVWEALTKVRGIPIDEDVLTPLTPGPPGPVKEN